LSCCITLFHSYFVSLLSISLFFPYYSLLFFFFNFTASTDLYTLSLHDALPILPPQHVQKGVWKLKKYTGGNITQNLVNTPLQKRSEEHTSELQSRFDLVCRLLLEKKK